MPRHLRLDALNTVHHVMMRGIERTILFRDDTDRADFVARVAAVAERGAWTVSAWALLPDHAHRLVRTGRRPLPRSMRSLLTGYAGAFNRRHHRVGHLFQNRHKSIVVEEAPSLLEVVRYLHLNPLRAKVVADLRARDGYPWTGHRAVLATVLRAWQDTRTALAQFGPTPARARKAYRAFVAAGIPQGRRPELQGGSLLRSLGGWAVVQALCRGREAFLGDERVLGSPEFVAALQRAAAAAAPGSPTSGWSAAGTSAGPWPTPWASVPRPSTKPSPAAARHAASGAVSRNNELFYLATWSPITWSAGGRLLRGAPARPRGGPAPRTGGVDAASWAGPHAGG